MAYISEEEINNIRENASIVDIISEYVALSKSGNDYVGICPFHEDHSPSMHVSTKLNLFKCFVCGVGGNVFSFVRKKEDISFPEAVKLVAEKSGISFNHNVSPVQNSKFNKEYALMDLSLKYFQNNLATQSGVDAKKYLNARGINAEIINEFKIGLSLNDNKLYKFLQNKNEDIQKAISVGLLNQSGIDIFDTFTDRIMIPICDLQGRVAGYTARAYKKDEKSKYINTKTTDIYVKGNILYNYFNAKDHAKREKEIILVEGNMDAISLSASGIKNVCALMGVVIQPNQIEALKKLNSKIILMLDSDNAGSEATIKVGDALYQKGLDVYVVRLNGAKDPDEYIYKNGVEALKENIKRAVKFFDYKLESLKENRNLNNIEDLTCYVKEVLNNLNSASEIEREVVIGRLSREYNLDAQVLKKGLVPPKKERSINKVAPPKKKRSKYVLASTKMIYAMLLNKDFYKIYINNLGFLINKYERDLVSLIGTYISKFGQINIAAFIDYVQKYPEVSNYLNEVLLINNEESIAENEFYDILVTVSKTIDEIEIKNLKEKIKNEVDASEKIKLMERLRELKKGCGNNEGN